MMEIRNCPVCGSLFVFGGRNFCPACMEKEEKDFQALRKFLDENPSATMEEISEATGVEVRKILQFLKEGRLVYKAPGPPVIACESCGAPISTGRLCDRCTAEITEAFVAIDRPEGQTVDPRAKMHLDRERRNW
ncbi:MAG: MerR family transcriptional regulator [Actinobacteria bacterium]|nr:MerR family transcriptional regulator [Actinomycetota bacterium]